MAGVDPENERTSMLLSCYLDGELTVGELAEVVIILESDLEAIAEFHRLQASRRVIRTLPLLNLPLELLPGGHLSEELSAYLDGELTTMELPAVTTHLDSCAECRAELGDLDRSRIAVRALPGVEAPAFLAVHRAEKEKRRRRSVWPAAAAAGGVAAAALAFTVGFGGGGSEPTAIDVADLQSRHAAVASVPAGATAFQVSSP
jgi:anti-sigma factor RsiW